MFPCCPRRDLPCGKNERDKGWAWVIAGAAFISSGATFGVWKTMSLFFNDWTSEFDADPGRVSYVQAISFAVLACASPVAGASVRRFGSRPTVILGGILAATGAGLSFFASSLTMLYIFIGGVAHFGICLTYLPSFISLGMWMDRRRSLANSLAEMGGPLMAFVLPLVFQKLRDSIGWRSTMLVAAGLYLTIVISGILQKPFEQEELDEMDESAADDVTDAAADAATDNRIDSDNNKIFIKIEDYDAATEPASNENEVAPIDEKAALPTRDDDDHATTTFVTTIPATPGLSQRIAFKLREEYTDLTSRLPPPVCAKILFYMIYSLFQFGGLFALNLFIVPYATQDRGFEEQEASYLLSINAALDLIGRPLSGAILSLEIFSRRRIELISVFVALYGLVCFLFRFAHSYYFFASLYGAAGLLFGFWNGTYWTVIPDIFGEELFPLAASCGMMMGGIALLLASPIAGSLIQTFVGYDGVAYQSAVQLIVASILLYLLKKNWSCCKIELIEKAPTEAPPIDDGSKRVGEKLAIQLNTEEQIADFLSVQSLPHTGSTFKRKTYSVMDLAMSMQSLNKQRSSQSLHKPSANSSVNLNQMAKSVSSLRSVNI